MAARVVVVGLSFGGRVHVPALRVAGFDVVGLVGRDPARTEQRAAELGIPHHGTSITDVVAASGADVATISTPPAAAGGGILNAAGVHALDRLQTWLGPITSVSGDVARVSGLEGGADDTFGALMRTQEGVSISVQHCSALRGVGAQICKVIGTEGSVWIDAGSAYLSTGGEPEAIEVPAELVPPPTPDYPADDPKHAFTGFELPLFIRLAERLRDEINGTPISPDMPATPTFADGLAAQRVIDAIRDSAANGGNRIELEGATP
jgi:predicted dehydrogenase